MVCSRWFLRSSFSLGAVLFSALVPATTAAQAKKQGAVSLPAAQLSREVSRQSLPLVFEQNAGQLPAGTAFAGRTQGYAVEVRPTELRFALPGKKTTRTIEMQFTGAQPGAAAGVVESPFRTNFYMSPDPKKWVTGVHNFDRVALRGLYPGVDAEFYSHNNEIEHDFIVAAGGDASRLAMHLSGAQSVKLTENGNVTLSAEEGSLRLHKPVAYQVMADGSHRSVAADFALKSSGADADLSFVLGAYDHSRALVIDPVITYATYVSGGAGSVPTGVVSDAAGNVYMTGRTASTLASFAATATSPATPVVPTAANYATFIARLSNATSGSQLTWVTYYGSATAYVQANAIAVGGATAAVVVGGQTTATDLSGTTGGFQAAAAGPAGTTYGFIANFAPATGVLGTATYVVGTGTTAGTTTVNALSRLSATDSTVVAAGATTGATFPATANALTSAGLTAVVNNTSLGKGILLSLSSNLATENYGTYVAGDIAATTSDTTLTGVVAGCRASTICVSGTTYGDFPQAGPYATAAVNPRAGTKLGRNSFAAALLTTAPTLTYSYWSGGAADDVASGLSLDASLNLYVFGQTQSTDLVTAASATSTVAGTATPSTPLDANFPAGAGTVGFVSVLNTSGKLNATTFLGSTTAASVSAVTGGVNDAAGNLYLSGTTNGIKASFPQATNAATTASITGTPVLPATQDLSVDSTATTLQTRGFLLEMPLTLSALIYKGFFGPPAGTASGVGVAVDGATAPNAYVAINETASAATAHTYTTASAAQQAPQQVATSSALVAKVAFGAPGSGASITGGPNTNDAPLAGVTYTNATTSTTVTFTWKITGAGTGATSIVFNLPYSQYLKPYTAVPTVSIDGAPQVGVCTLGTISTANTNPGITCVLPALAAASVATITLSDAVTSAITGVAGANFTVSASGYDAQGDSLTLDQTVTINKAPVLTLTYAASPATVNAALSAADATTPNTTVTYTFVITNTSTYDSPATTLASGLSSLSKAFTIKTMTSSTGCNPTTASCDVAPNSSLTYTVTGVYVGSDLGSTTSPITSSFSATTPPSVTTTVAAVPTTTTGTPSGTTTVTIQGNVSISVAVTTSATTYNSGFKLGDTGVQIIATATNSGPNQATNVTVPVTLPQGFTETAVTASNGTATCSTPAPPTSCTATFATVNGNNGTATLTITGFFKDTGLASDAVAPPTTSATPTPATVAASPTTGNVTATVAAGGITVGSGAYVTSVTGGSKSILVTRVNTLSYALTVGTPITGGKVNELSPNHATLPAATALDTITYTATVANTGTSVARGLYFTIPLPTSASGANAASTPAVSYSVATSTPNNLNCTVGATAITCVESDLTTAAPTATTTAASETYTVTYTLTFNEQTVPQATVSGTATAAQTAGSFYAAAAGYNTSATTGTTSATSITVQRSTNLVQSLAIALPNAAPASFVDTADTNLDEHIANNAPGINDTLTLTAKLYNNGVNDAAGVVVIVPLPAYLELFTLPAGCTITSAAATVPTFAVPFATGAAGDSLTCRPPSITTPAATSAGQVAATVGTAACTGVTVTTSGCYVVSFPAKFVDAPSTATIVAAAAKTTVTPQSAVATGNDVDAGTGLTSPVPPAFGVQRAAHLVETGLPTANPHPPTSYVDTTDINLDEHTPGNVGGVNDQVLTTATTYNSGPNYALIPSVTIVLPPYFELFSAVPASCTVTGGTGTLPYVTGATGGTLVCTSPTTYLNFAGSCTGATVSSAQCIVSGLALLGKFVDAPTTATIVGANATGPVSIPAATVAGTYSDSNKTQTPAGPSNFTVQRAAHLVESVGYVRVGAAPATFKDAADINLDEHTTNNAPGTNDTLTVTSLTSNSGVNYAVGINLVVPVSPFFLIVQAPAGCVVTGNPGAAFPYSTGSAGASLTCSPVVAPAGALMYAGSCPAGTTTSTSSCYVASFQAKFVDATTAATVVGSNPTGTATFTAPAMPTGAFNNSDKNAAAPTVTPANITVQRAAHVRLITNSPITTTYSDNSPLALDGTTPLIGQAAPGVNASTRVLTGGLVYNCIRYGVTVVNDGPNYANTPAITYNLNAGALTVFNYEQKSLIGGSTPLPPVNCLATASGGGVSSGAGPAQNFAVGPVTYGGGTQTVVLDGYYGMATLGTTNTGLSTFSNTAISFTDYNDSNPAATTAKDFQASKVVEVVNTPINSVASGPFKIVPYNAAGAPTLLSLIFNSVTIPGATASNATTSSAGVTLPSGKSPYVPDASAVKTLYQFGRNPMYYNVPSTAVSPTTGTNPTIVCITQASATGLPDVFVKPERTLLWELQNGSAGTTYRSVPNITSTGVLSGDITFSVTPSSGPGYVKLTTLAFPAVPQAQPSELCGQVNGFTTSTTAATAATFSVLEPVNFPPYVVAASSAGSTVSGKGGAVQSNIYLQVSNTQTHDANDNDPCYIGGVRSSCDDNPYLEVFLFADAVLGNPVLLSTLPTDTSVGAGPNARTVQSANVASGTTYYVAVADQATGADVLNTNLAINPFQKQGGFLISGGPAFQVCNPAITTAQSLNANACASVSGTSAQRVVMGTGYTVGNVGAQGVLITGGSGSIGGLIPLPVPASNAIFTLPVPTTPPTNPSTGPAIGVVSAGQSVGFVWNWLNQNVQQTPATRYTLTCSFVKSLTDATAIAAPQGASCNITTADPAVLATPNMYAYSAGNPYPPTIYVTTKGPLNAQARPGVWQQLSSGIVLSLLVPVLLFRRRLGKPAVVLALILSLATMPFLTGCGAGGDISSTNTTPSGTYFLQVTATSTTATPQAVVSAVFEVIVN